MTLPPPSPAIAAIRDYGAACVKAERERIVELEARLINYTDLLAAVLDAKEIMLAAGVKQSLFADMFAEFCCNKKIADGASIAADYTAWRRDEDARAYGAACAKAERERAAKICAAIAKDYRALYTGLPPYTGSEPGRAGSHADGMSDGASFCEDAIMGVS